MLNLLYREVTGGTLPLIIWNNIYPNNCLTEWKGQRQLELSWWYSKAILSLPVLWCRGACLLTHSGLWMSLQTSKTRTQLSNDLLMLWYVPTFHLSFWEQEEALNSTLSDTRPPTDPDSASPGFFFFFLEQFLGLCYMDDIVFYSSLPPHHIQFLLFLRCSSAPPPVPCPG